MAGMRETTLTELSKNAKIFFDAVENGETIRVYRNGRPVADIVQRCMVEDRWGNTWQIATHAGP